MAPFSNETIAASKELVSAVMEAIGCHGSPCSWVLIMMEDGVLLQNHHTWSLIFIGRLEKQQHMQKSQCPKRRTAVGILDQLT